MPLNDNSPGSGENWIDRWQSGIACRQRRVTRGRRGGEGAKIGSGESVRAAENTFRDADYSYARLLINPAYRVFGHELVCWLASCLSFDLTKVITNEFDIGAPGLGINVRPAGGSRFNRYTAEHRSTKRADSTMDIERAYCLVSRVFFPPDLRDLCVCYTRAGV